MIIPLHIVRPAPCSTMTKMTCGLQERSMINGDRCRVAPLYKVDSLLTEGKPFKQTLGGGESLSSGGDDLDE